jgi:hypothetical protein
MPHLSRADKTGLLLSHILHTKKVEFLMELRNDKRKRQTHSEMHVLVTRCQG